MAGFLLAALVALASAHGLQGPSARALCTHLGTDDTLRSLPPALYPEARQALGLEHMPPGQVLRSTVFRCLHQRVEICNWGANLPCGKANLSASLPQAKPWCESHPDSPFVPFYISGHNSIYRWHCVKGAPETTGPAAKLDERGFLVRYWRLLPARAAHP